MQGRSYFEEIETTHQLKDRIDKISEHLNLKKQHFALLANYQPPPYSVSETAHIMMLYIGLHSEKTIEKCRGGDCFREFQRWCNKYYRSVKGDIVVDMFNMQVSNQVLDKIGKIMQGSHYLNEQSLRCHCNASCALLMAIMGRLKLRQLENKQIVQI